MTVMTIEDLDLSAGHYVKGIPLSDTVFLAATTFNQVKLITRNPVHLQSGIKRNLFDSDEIEEERDLHVLIQRALTGNKAKNVLPYRRYIESVVNGGAGVLPPMHLWSQDPLMVVRHGITNYTLVPNGDHLPAIDGETQLTAHWALDEHATTPEIRKAHRDFPIACVIHHGISVSTARQYFHDLNVLAVRPNTSLGLSMDTKDPIMKVVGDLEAAIPALQGRVDKQARQLKKNSPKVVTLQSLRQMVVNVAKGISGVQYGARPAPIDEENLAELKDVAIGWIGAFLNTFEKEIGDREHSLASSGPALAAVGAMGEVLLRSAPEDRPQLQARMLASLREVNWTKGEHWLGIAGNYTPGGVFSVKGTKEVAYAVFNALTDRENGSYSRVRTIQTPSPEAAPAPTPAF
jgi:hypothetical protein